MVDVEKEITVSILLKTHKMLWARAAGRCAFPECRHVLIMDRSKQNDESLIGEECHMVAQEAIGPRGNSTLTAKERDKYDNLILLCRVHHKLIDDQPETYPVSRLIEMKEEHEKWVQKSLQGTSPIWHIPYQHNLLFTGREQLIDLIHDQLTITKTTVLTQPQAICGLGGIGKTQAAIEYAYTYRDAYQAVLWVRAATRDTIISDFVTIAHLLRLPEKDELDQNISVAAVKLWLATHSNWLLIFDNVEDLEIIHYFVSLAAKGHILLTTRSQITGSNITGIEVEKMNQEESLLFFLRRAKKLASDGTLDQVSRQLRSEAGAIVEILDGLPLALDQAGAYIDETQCSFFEYLDLYRVSHKELLKRRGDLSSDHPEPVATTWSLSFQKVQEHNPAAAELVQSLAFLDPDAIPEELLSQGASELGPILEPVTSNALSYNEAIRVLRKFSLVKRNPETKMLSVHRLVQAVLKDEMPDDIQRQWAERVLRAVNHVFPNSQADMWDKCKRYLSQVDICAANCIQYGLLLPEGTRLFSEVGSYWQSHAQYIAAEPFKKLVLAICEQIMGDHHPSTATALNNLATLYKDQGKYEQAEPLYQRAMSILEHSSEPGTLHPDMAGMLNNLACLYRLQGKYEQAELFFQRAGLISEQVYGKQHENTIIILNNLAGVYYDQGQYECAKELYQQVAFSWEQIHGAEHPEMIQILNSLANVYHAQGLHKQAEPIMEQALALSKKIFGSQHPYTATCLDSHAELYYDLGEYVKAEPLYQQVLEIRKQVQGTAHPDTAQSMNKLAKCYHTQKQFDKAEPLYQQALEIRKQVLGLHHLQIAESLTNLAVLYAETSQYDQAKTLYQQAITIYEEINERHPGLADTLNNSAMLHYTVGQYEQAAQLTKRALKIRQETRGPEHYLVGQSLNNLALIYQAQSKYDQAEPLYQQALEIYKNAFGQGHPGTVNAQQNYESLLRAKNAS